MERSYRASNALYAYAFLLGLTALLLGIEAIQRLRSGATGTSILLAILALAWGGCAAYLGYRWGRLRVSLRSDALAVYGDGPERRVPWSNVIAVREYRGPAFQLAIRGLLPGPYLPHGLLRGESVLEVEARPTMTLHFRQALVDSYGAFRQDVLRSVSRDVPVDLHARWWRLDDPTDFESDDTDDGEDDDSGSEELTARQRSRRQSSSLSRAEREALLSRQDRGDRTGRGAVDRLSPPRDRTTRPFRTGRADGGDAGTQRSRDRRW